MRAISADHRISNITMKLIFLYGPPAVGKLTVGKALAKFTGYKIFHNQLTNDLVESIFDWGEKPFHDFVHRYRLELIEAAAKHKVQGVIFTFVYWRTYDDAFIREVVRRVKKHRGKMCFVQLTCDVATLLQRVRHTSRRAFRKIRTIQKLRTMIQQKDMFSPVPYRKNLVINTRSLPPAKAARIIKKHYKL